MTTDKITNREVRDTLRAIVREMPDARNPTRSGICLYHVTKNGQTKRCLIGELGHRLGLPRPAAEAGSVEGVVNRYWRDCFSDPETIGDRLGAIQVTADGDGLNPTPWGSPHISATINKQFR